VISKVAVARIIPRLEATLREGGNHRDLRQQLFRSLTAHLGFDGGCVATLDPVTAMWTDCEVFEANRDPAFEAQLFDAEYQHADVAPMTELAERALPAAVLSVETEGDLARSVRYRKAFRPAGIGDELRLVLVESGIPWGSVQLVRASGSHFLASEAEALAVLSVPVAQLLRRALLLEACREPDEPSNNALGMLMLQGGRVIDASASALSILGTSPAQLLPAATHGLMARARENRAARASLPGPAGGWLVLHSIPMGDRVAIIVEKARPFQLAEVVSLAMGLTERERQVVAHVARGRSTKQIGAELSISDWTVQDHLKSVFAKVGVSTRQELVAALFFGYWAPEHARRSLPSPHGHYKGARSRPT
jgi:DNA-binding CsgD family transcriptional regulator